MRIFLVLAACLHIVNRQKFFPRYDPCLLCQACTVEGVRENQVIEFAWNSISQFDLDEEEMAFMFQYRRTGKPDKWVKLLTHHFIYLYECFERIQEEHSWD